MKIDQEFDWETYSWIKRGPRRIKILNNLSNAKKPITATELKKAQNIDITQAAFTLNELWVKGLLKCLNPKDHHGKLFILSKKGVHIRKRIMN